MNKAQAMTLQTACSRRLKASQFQSRAVWPHQKSSACERCTLTRPTLSVRRDRSFRIHCSTKSALQRTCVKRGSVGEAWHDPPAVRGGSEFAAYGAANSRQLPMTIDPVASSTGY